MVVMLKTKQLWRNLFEQSMAVAQFADAGELTVVFLINVNAVPQNVQHLQVSLDALFHVTEDPLVVMDDFDSTHSIFDSSKNSQRTI